MDTGNIDIALSYIKQVPCMSDLQSMALDIIKRFDYSQIQLQRRSEPLPRDYKRQGWVKLCRQGVAIEA